MRNASLLLLVLGVAFAFKLQSADAQISFSLPGKWGHKRSGFNFGLPGKWASLMKRADAGYGKPFSLPGQWAGQGKRMAPVYGWLDAHNDIMPGCDEASMKMVLELYDLIKEHAMEIDRCVPRGENGADKGEH